MRIQYLEIVTREMDAMCSLYSDITGASFGDPVDALGGARTTEHEDGSQVGTRPPMRDSERAVVRPYMLVEDLAACIEAAENRGAQIAMPPTAIEGRGQFAIVIQGGIEAGFWQL